MSDTSDPTQSELIFSEQEKEAAEREARLIRDLPSYGVIFSDDVVSLSEKHKLMPSKVLACARMMKIQIGSR